MKFDVKYKAGDSVTEKVNWLNFEREKNQALKDRRFKKVKIVSIRKDEE